MADLNVKRFENETYLGIGEDIDEWLDEQGLKIMLTRQTIDRVPGAGYVAAVWYVDADKEKSEIIED